MSGTKIDFSEISWDESNEGVRAKTALRSGKRLRLVEFADKFVELDWCRKGHIGYVLEGEIEIAFPDRTETFVAGDGIMIVSGEEERHRARVIGAVARLILVEEA